MNLRDKIIKLMTAVIVIVLLLNPETMQMALFIDAVGLDILFLLFEVQLLAIGIAVYHRTLKPFIGFFAQLLPWRRLLSACYPIKAHAKACIVMSLPSETTLMHALVIGVAME